MYKIRQWVFKKQIEKFHDKFSGRGFITISIPFHGFSEGHHSFRIPAIITLPNNIVCGFAEGRINSMSDYAQMNMTMKRSVDGGKTWGNLQILMKNGDNGLEMVHNPCPIYDKTTKELLLLVIVNRLQPYVIKSKDLGKSWSEAEKIDGIHVDGWTCNGACPGHGIQLESGRLLVTGMYNTQEKNTAEYWGNYYIYSDDHGTTWQLGHVFDFEANESLCASLGGNTIYTIARANHPPKNGVVKKLYTISEDGGIISSPHKYCDDLIVPTCQSSIIEYGKGGLLYCGPIKDKRSHLTLKVSNDGGKTFPYSKLIYENYSGYSDLTVFEDGTVGILFESGPTKYLFALVFIRLKLEL